MFDIGFLELLICGIIALLILGPERLPKAARATGRWIGRARRVTRSFTEELDRQIRAEEIRERIRKEGSEMGFEDIQKNYQEGLAKAREYKHLVDEPKQSGNPLTPADSRTETPRADSRKEDSTNTKTDTHG